MAEQVTLSAEVRDERGKGAAGRLRRSGRVPAIVYGHDVEPTAVHVDALDLYHVLHTEAGMNVLIQLELNGSDHLVIARDPQRHAVRGDMLHIDFLAVDAEQLIAVEVPIHVVDIEDADPAGVLNQVLHTVPIRVRPTEVPNYLEVSVAGLGMGDVKRVEDLAGQLPSSAEFDIEPDRTIITINAPDILEEPSTDETLEPEDVIAGPDDEGVPADASEVPETSQGTDSPS